MTASIAKMSGFLEVAITYTFHSPLCVRCLRLSGSSAYRGAVRAAILVSYMYRGDGRRNFDAAGEGKREKFLSSYFSRFFPNCHPPLSWFETHPRWPPVTQYTIVGLACEQSSYYHDYTLPEMHRERKFPGKTIQTGSSSRSVRNSCDRRNI